jgi:thiosulfate reductase cytochrome b subunit
MGRILILVGIALILVGLLMTIGNKLPWIGKLPGDIIIKKDHFSFYFPLASCIIVSVILTLLLYIFRR